MGFIIFLFLLIIAGLIVIIIRTFKKGDKNTSSCPSEDNSFDKPQYHESSFPYPDPYDDLPPENAMHIDENEELFDNI